jgi:hypothetical protein
MTEAARSERTARVLGARLDELARALERGGVRPEAAVWLLESAAVATAHAVMLDLLSVAQATELWREAAERHPDVEPLRGLAAVGVLEEAAA